MCVAVLVESERGPTREELLAMDTDNPHGGGVAYPEGDRIRYKKGLNYAQIHKILKRVPRPCLVHFRWATHGGKEKHLAHPFPLGPRALVSKALTGVAPAVLIHNGVWYDYANWIPDWAEHRRAQLSDTAVAAYVAEKWEDVLDDVVWSNAVMRSSGRNRADVTLRGRWVEHNGDMYSNLNWQSRMERWKTSTPVVGTAARTPSHSAYDDVPWNFEHYLATRDYPPPPDGEDLTGQLTFGDWAGARDEEDLERMCTGYPPRDPRWTPDGRLVEGGRVLRVVPHEDDDPIPAWMAEHREVQEALAAMADEEDK